VAGEVALPMVLIEKKLYSNFNNIRVRSFILSGAPINEINGLSECLAALAAVTSGSPA
jgi:hypothetical protein